MTTSSTRGLRLLKAIQNYSKKMPNQWDTGVVFNKVQITSASEGRICGKFKVDSTMCNMLDSLHGGYVATIIDVFSLFGQISHEKGKIAWTTHLDVVYLNAAYKGDEVSVETSPVQIGKPTVVEVVLKNVTSGNIIAKGTSSFVLATGKILEITEEKLGFKSSEN